MMPSRLRSSSWPRAESEQLAVNVGVVLAQQRRGFHFDRRILESHRTSRHREVAAHRMLDRDDHAALLEMRIVQQLDAVEHRAARDAGLAEDPHHLVLGVASGPFVDDRGQRLDVLRAVPSYETLVAQDLGMTDHFAQAHEHLGRGAQDVAIIVVAAGRALVDVARTAAADAVAAARRRFVRDVRAHHRHAHEVQHRFLHRDFDLLPLAGPLALDVRGEHADRRMHPGAGVADRRSGLERRRTGKSGQRHRAAGRLRNHVEAFVLAVRAVRAEALDGQVDEARIYFAQAIVAEAEAFERAERKIFREHIDLLDQVDEHRAALLALEVERDAAFVGVEQNEVVGIDARLFGEQPAALLAHLRRLDLDHVGAEPREHLGARGARLELRHVQNFDPAQRLFHCDPPSAYSYLI